MAASGQPGDMFVCSEADMRDGDVRIVTVDGIELGLIRHRDEFYAYRNYCPHQGGPACEGLRMPRVLELLDGEQRSLGQSFDEDDIHIVCPWHGYEYRLADGRNAVDPHIRLTKYAVRRIEGKVYVNVTERG